MQTIKELYQAKYPECEYGAQICPSATVFKVLAEIEHVYEVIDVCDSIVREGVFSCICDVMGIEYAQIYDLWLQRAGQLRHRIDSYEELMSRRQEESFTPTKAESALIDLENYVLGIDTTV